MRANCSTPVIWADRVPTRLSRTQWGSTWKSRESGADLGLSVHTVTRWGLNSTSDMVFPSTA